MDGGSLTNPSNHDIRASRVHSCEVNRGSVSCIASWPLNSSALLRWLALFAALRCFPLHQLGWDNLPYGDRTRRRNDGDRQLCATSPPMKRAASIASHSHQTPRIMMMGAGAPGIEEFGGKSGGRKSCSLYQNHDGAMERIPSSQGGGQLSDRHFVAMEGCMPLSGVKRTCLFALHMSAFDLKADILALVLFYRHAVRQQQNIKRRRGQWALAAISDRRSYSWTP